VREALRDLTGDLDRSIRDTAHAALQASRSGQLAGTSTVRAWPLRNPVKGAKKAFSSWIGFEDLRRLWRLEKITGTPTDQIANKIMVRIYADAELARRYRHTIALISYGYYAVIIVAVALAIAALRLALWADIWLLSIWYVVVPLVALAAITLMPGVARLTGNRVIRSFARLIQWLAASALTIGVLGGLLYTWWIRLLAIVALCVIVYCRVALVRSRRYRRVGEVARRVQAAMATQFGPGKEGQEVALP